MAIIKAVTLPTYTGQVTKCCDTAVLRTSNTVTGENSETCVGCSTKDPVMISYNKYDSNDYSNRN